ncbi:MAG TPA: hypothetical protein VK989_18970 [Polyangia bacterium]|nr:hypothetical protein [Polyangia bacterium]
MLVLLLVEGVYYFVVTAGTFTTWPQYLSYYDYLAEGFRAGHLHLSIAPAPELVAAPDPFDPALTPYWAPDASYYKGQYFIYWGPVPALLLAAVKIVLRISAFVGDQYLCFAFTTLQLVFGALLLERVARRAFTQVPFWALLLGVLTFGLATPTAHSLANGAIYNTAIAAGQAFMVGGVLFAFDAVASASASAPPARRLLLPGLFFALALGCRISLPPSILLLSLLTVAAARTPAARTWPQLARDVLWIGLLPGLGLGALMLYNRLRFDSWTDFGGSRQLSSLRYAISPAYLAPNLYTYLLRPLQRRCEFPFLVAPWQMGARAFAKGMVLPPGYFAGEPLVGILPGLPIVWLGVAAIWAGVRALRGRRASESALTPRDERTRLFLYCLAVFAILCTNSAFPLLFLFMASMRQLGDIEAGLVLVGILGAWWLLDRARAVAWRRRVAAAVVVGLSVGTIVIGLLLGYEGYGKHFATNNPNLDEALRAKLSWCGARARP